MVFGGCDRSVDKYSYTDRYKDRYVDIYIYRYEGC